MLDATKWRVRCTGSGRKWATWSMLWTQKNQRDFWSFFSIQYIYSGVPQFPDPYDYKWQFWIPTNWLDDAQLLHLHGRLYKNSDPTVPQEPKSDVVRPVLRCVFRVQDQLICFLQTQACLYQAN